MNVKNNFKEKLIDRIKGEGIEYKESFNNSLYNQYSYQWEISYKEGCYDGGISITSPSFSDETELEQTYKIAHELGHHNTYKKLNPLILKVCQVNSTLIKNMIERKAWKEAEKICIEEEIPIGPSFYMIRNRSLRTYSIVSVIRDLIFNAVKSYYIILVCFYLIYKGINDNINDFFGILKCFDGISIDSVKILSKGTWACYIVLQALRNLLYKYNWHNG